MANAPSEAQARPGNNPKAAAEPEAPLPQRAALRPLNVEGTPGEADASELRA